MNAIRNVKSGLRFAVNEATRALIWDEALRKRLAECYYAWAARRVNAREGFAARTASDLLDWRATMGFRFECSREVYRANSFYGIGKLCARSLERRVASKHAWNMVSISAVT